MPAHLILWLAATLAFLLVGPASKHFALEELAPGVWAAIHNDDGGRAICNAGIIDLGDKTVVFDPFMTPEAAWDLKKVAEEMTGRKVAIVVNSHFHNDHIRGNQIFTPDARIISSHWTGNQIPISEKDEQEWERKNAAPLAVREKENLKTATGSQRKESIMWIAYYEGIVQSLPELKITAPDVTFADSLWIHGSKRSLRLVEYRNGHTTSDVVLQLPQDGIVFMGDLFFVGRHPWLGDGDPESWQRHLKSLTNDPAFFKYVPGHGPVSGKAEMRLLQNYLSDIQQLANDRIKQNLPDSAIMQEPIPAAYNNWWFGRFHFYNMRFFCRQRKK